MSGGGKGKQEYTVGYWYGLGYHAVFCHGPVDAVTAISVGERLAWSGNVVANTDLAIDQPGLFGGEEREGGLQGTARIRLGAAGQAPDPYLQAQLGAPVPAFRGVLSMIWSGLVSANNPYIKPVAVRARRIPSAWYPERATIGTHDANPAHIIRDCLIDPNWGMGYPEADIDTVSFAVAADTLYAENFGLSILWDQETSIEDFIGSVLAHVDGVLYVHPRTGLFTLRLARADYDVGALAVLSPTNVRAIESFTRPSWSELGNQVTLTYRDRDTDRDVGVTVQDIAAIEAAGGVVAHRMSFPGIARADLANRVAQRELRQLSSALAKVTLVANRQAASLMIGDVFKLVWPAYGIDQMVLRVARISYGELTSGAVRIEAIEDVFGLPLAAYADPPATAWADPINLPAPVPAGMAYEVPYWSVVKDLVGEWPSILADIDPTEGVVATLGVRPSADAFDYHAYAWEQAKNAWVDRGRGQFAPSALLAAAMAQGAATVTVALTQAVDLDLVAVDDFAIIDDEWLWVTAIDAGAPSVTLARGVLDTVPIAHSAGSRVWFVTPHYIAPEYVVTETAQLRLCPKTGRGELAVSAAATLSRPIAQRFIRPYPPGQVRINGSAYPQAVAGDLAIGWAQRNRVTQTAGVVLQTDGNLTPESGQTTTLRLYDDSDMLRRTISGISGTSQTWSLAQIIADGAGASGRIRIELEAERTDASGTFTSLQKHVIEVDRAGYGLNYGKYYGGI